MKSFISMVLKFYYNLLRVTCRVQRVGDQAVFENWRNGLPVVFACPHGLLLPSLMSFEGHRVAVLASLSKDGDLISRVLESRGFSVVRGSSSRKGAAALVQLRTRMRKGYSVGLTFDGPKGPPLRVKPGVLKCAEFTGGHAFYCHVVPTSGLWLRLRSWDRFLLPLPGCSWTLFFIDLGNFEKNGISMLENQISNCAQKLQSWVYEPRL